MMARLQTISGLPEQALFTLEPLGQTPSPAYELEKARALLRSGGTAESRPILESLAAPDQEAGIRRSARKLLGICEDQDGNHKKAQEIFRQLLVEGEEPSIRYNLGYSLMTSNSYNDVLVVLKPLLDSPKYLEARYLAAAALGRLRKNTEARGLLEGYLSEGEINRLLEGQ
jgi:Flp pilus assembly protein TadD